jgi:transposase-like protein
MNFATKSTTDSFTEEMLRVKIADLEKQVVELELENAILKKIAAKFQCEAPARTPAGEFFGG